jgi:hypothetical protein
MYQWDDHSSEQRKLLATDLSAVEVSHTCAAISPKQIPVRSTGLIEELKKYSYYSSCIVLPDFRF